MGTGKGAEKGMAMGLDVGWGLGMEVSLEMNWGMGAGVVEDGVTDLGLDGELGRELVKNGD